MGILLATAVNAADTSPPAASTDNMLHLRLRTGEKKLAPIGLENVEKEAAWDPHKTAIIICDMWNDHWCKGAAQRVAELAGTMNTVVMMARRKGVFIIHAPSSVTSFYKNTPQRQRAQKAPFAKPPLPLSTDTRWGTTWCWPDPTREHILPIDDSDMGCDCKVKCPIREAWTRQIATIEIGDADAITDDGQETYNLLAERGIDNVILMGVHLNMCVLGRPFGIRQMVREGKNVVLMRDMTDTMYNHEMRPRVNHFEGTDLVVEHVEKYWCPSITSTDITGIFPFRFSEDRR
ncbi:MAG TPA: protein-signal peptide and transmembrane prediction [Verrucomicrobiae bacterium]|nr:protein-signal peptide and transmembrane prediction [Verrucomicrobiae bacterium]